MKLGPYIMVSCSNLATNKERTWLLVHFYITWNGWVYIFAGNVMCTWRSGEVNETVSHVPHPLGKGTFTTAFMSPFFPYTCMWLFIYIVALSFLSTLFFFLNYSLLVVLRTRWKTHFRMRTIVNNTQVCEFILGVSFFF